jgi:hypothetical protein
MAITALGLPDDIHQLRVRFVMAVGAVGVCLGVRCEQFRVGPSRDLELVVVAVFDDVSVVEDVDAVGVGP